MRIITVKELIEELETYNPNLKVMFSDDGPSHDFPVVKEDIGVVNGMYCPFDFENYPIEGEDVLRIGRH